MLSKKSFLALSLLISYMHPAFSAASSTAVQTFEGSAVDARLIFDQARHCLADSSKHAEAITLFKQLFSHDGFGPYARCNAALLTKSASEKKDLVNSIIEGTAFGSHKPDRALQASACDMLMHAYEAEGNQDAVLISAINRLIIDEAALSDTNAEHIQFFPCCYHALNIISARALAEPNIELLHLPFNTIDGNQQQHLEEQMEFLNKVLSSAEEYNIPVAQIMRILSTIDNDQAVEMFTQLYKEHSAEAIDLLCKAATKGHVGARDFALILITENTCNAEENIALFKAATGLDISIENKAQTIEQILSAIKQEDYLACGHAVSLAALPLCDEDEKMALLTAAAEARYALAHYALGMHYKKTAKGDLARTHLTFAANAHIARAYLELATLLPQDIVIIIKSLEELAADPAFPLQEKAQELLADHLCLWSKTAIEYETHNGYIHPTDALETALNHYNAIITFSKRRLDKAIFDKYITALNTLALHSLELEDKLYKNGLICLKDLIETQPAAQTAYNKLTEHLEAYKKFITTRRSYDLGHTSLIFRIQNQDRFISSLIDRLSNEPEKEKLLFAIAETYLKKQPDGAKISSLKGIISFYKKDYKAALEHFKQAVRFNRNDVPSKSLAIICQKLIKR